MSGDKSQKTEKPTAQRLKKARKEGQTPRSPDISAWAGLLLAVFLVKITFTTAGSVTKDLLRQVGKIAADPDPAAAMGLLVQGLAGAARALAPLVLGLLVLGLVTNAAQGGIHPTGKKLKPKMERLNPLKGIKRVFGGQGVWNAAKAVLKTSVLGVLLYRAIKTMTPLAESGTVVPTSYVLHAMGDVIFNLARDCAIAGLVMAAADYAYQRRKTTKSIMMSKQEIKDEYKNTEGDPAMKGARRSMQLSMSRNRMMAAVTDADVVLVNPTHVAVALKYDSAKGAPRVVAKGAGAIAAKIRARAQEHRVPMVQDIPLARTLYRVCDLGQEIPLELYTSVARILAFIFALKARGVAAGTHHRPPTPEKDLVGIKKPTKRRRKQAQLIRPTVR